MLETKNIGKIQHYLQKKKPNLQKKNGLKIIFFFLPALV